MNKYLRDLIRDDIRALKPYKSAKDIAKQNDFKGNIWLDANLSPYAPYLQHKSAELHMQRDTQSQSQNGHYENKEKSQYIDDGGFNRYAPQQPQDLREKLSNIYDVNVQNILLTRGSDEGIDLLIRAFCEAKKDTIIICPPTFGMYEVSAKIQGANVLKVPLKSDMGFGLDIKGIVNIAKKSLAKLIFIPSPNAPMGHMMRQEDILNLCESLQNQSFIVIDEAYIEFSCAKSMTRFLDKYPNLVILRTLSKAYAMAGLRIGSLITDDELINILSNIQAPYPLSKPSINIALNALCDKGLEQTNAYIKEAISQRDIMAKRLQTLAFIKNVYPSDTNFLLILVDNAKALMDYMADNGIIMRAQTSQMPNTIRFSMGTTKQSQIVWDKLRGFGGL